LSQPGVELEALLTLMIQLRSPQGCPWDREQTFASIAPFTIEEAYEVADAIARQDLGRLRDELGDLLFQVVFHARMAQEAGAFDFADVARGIRTKLIRRHPHVFGEPSAGTREPVAVAQLHRSWEAQKAHERAAEGHQGALADIPPALPALTRAAKLGRRAARVGFDWDTAAGVRSKIDEELGEVDAALRHEAPAEVAEEIGDLLFAVANWARHLGVDPEEALRAAGRKFERRFAHMEQTAAVRQLPLEGLTAAQWEQLWEAAKSFPDKV
jgi:ATP diphosphatase